MNESGFVKIVDPQRIAKALMEIDPDEAPTNLDMEKIVLQHIKETPVMSDALRGRQLGISKNTVRKWRDLHGFPPLLEKRCVQCGEVKRATHTSFTVIDYGDGYRDVCNECLSNPTKWYGEVEEMFRRAGW